MWETILFTALFATVLAFLVQTKAQQFTSATHVALIFTMEPIFALLTAVMAGGETITPRQGMGAVLILTGMLAAEFLDSRNGEK